MRDIHRIKEHIADVMGSISIHMDETFLWGKDNSLTCIAELIKRLSLLIANSESLLDQLSVARDELMFILQQEMEDKEIESFESDELTVKMKKNPPKLLIHDESTIDKGYFYEETQTKLNKDLIKRHIKEGYVIQGCEIVQDHRIDIKYKAVKAKECV